MAERLRFGAAGAQFLAAAALGGWMEEGGAAGGSWSGAHRGTVASGSSKSHSALCVSRIHYATSCEHTTGT